MKAVHDALPSTTIEDNAGVHDLSSITVEAIGGIDVAEQDPSVGEPLTSDEDVSFPYTVSAKDDCLTDNCRNSWDSLKRRVNLHTRRPGARKEQEKNGFKIDVAREN
jgi:hypothetical protein